MLEWITIIVLIFLGLGFIIAEVVFVPGTTLLGLFGLLFTIIGIILSYVTFGAGVGTFVLVIAITVGIVSLVISFRSGIWEKFALKSSIDSKFNEGSTRDLQVGQEGKTMSSLRPMGKAEFDNQEFEVTTMGNFLGTGENIRIVSIKDNKIIVELIK